MYFWSSVFFHLISIQMYWLNPKRFPANAAPSCEEVSATPLYLGSTLRAAMVQWSAVCRAEDHVAIGGDTHHVAENSVNCCLPDLCQVNSQL